MRYATRRAAIDDADYFDSAAARCEEKAAEFRRLAQRCRLAADQIEVPETAETK